MKNEQKKWKCPACGKGDDWEREERIIGSIIVTACIAIILCGISAVIYIYKNL